MAVTTEISWGDGTSDKIYLTRNASEGNQTVMVSSDANTGAARSKVVTFSASGVTPVTLTVNQAAGSPVLPSGYTALTYVENPLNNSAYINTGISTGATVGFEVDAMFYDEVTSDSSLCGCLFGGRTRANYNDFQITTYAVNPNTNRGTFRRGRSSQNYNAHLPAINTRFQASLVGNTYSIGGSDYTTSANITTERDIYLFALNNNDSPTQYGHLRIYRFKLTSGGNLVLDYVPCKRDADNVVGFYDLVAEAFVPPTSGTLTGIQ